MAWYDTGTVTVTNGSTTVTGSGTDFLTGVQVGEAFYAPDDNLYEIASITSATQLLLADNYAGSTQSGQSYKIVPTQSLVADLSKDVTDLITDYAEVKDKAVDGKFDDGTVTDPAIRFYEDTDTGFYRAGANEIGVSVGGVSRATIDSTGLDVTGTVNADDSLIVDGGTGYASLELGGDSGAYIDLKSPFSDDYDSRILTEGSDLSFTCSTGSINLIADGGQKLATTSTGIDVTGTVTADGVVVGDTSASYSAVFITSSTTGESELRLGDTDTDAGSVSYTNSDDTMTFRAAAGARMSLDSTGIDVTGTVTADGLTIEPNDAQIQFNASAYKIKGGANYGDMRFEAPRFRFYESNGVALQIDNNDISFYEDTGTTAKFFWDASAESLGIGTSSPSSKLHLSTGSDSNLGNIDFTIGGSNASNARAAKISKNTSSPYELTIQSGNHSTSNSDLVFKESDTDETMRLSSGNVLVGTTNANNVSDGIRLKPDGYISAANTSGPVMYANRLSTDGSILSFLKDGSTVGSIGTNSGDLNINGGANHSGIRFQATGLYPLENGTTSSGEIDLGAAGSKFKNLYLSGGVYLGGTGSANKLDDYEEGTWTPSYVPTSGSFGSISYNLQNGRYIKIGQMVMVTCQIRINTFSLGTASGELSLTGLPFNAIAESSLASVPLNTQQNWLVAPTMGFVQGNSTTIRLTRMPSNGGTYAFSSVSNMMTGTSVNRLRFSAVYYTS
jgi:hypothetical protein